MTPVDASIRWLLPLVVVVMVATSSTSSNDCASTESISDSTSWTVMIYMAADVVDSLPWELDINEMEAAVQADGTNVIALVDPPGASDSMLLKITHDEDLMNSEIVSERLDDGGEVIQGTEVNTGSPETLTAFIIYCASEHPADRLVLFLWGHGSGWRGVCPDGNDLLTLPELRSSLDDAEAALDRGLDLIVLDVCAGATLELAYEICDHSELLVGSELSVSAEGLPYTQVLDALASAPEQTAEDFGRATAESYIAWAPYGSSSLTAVSLFDLKMADRVADLLNTISELGMQFDRLYHSDMVSATSSSEHTDDRWNVDLGGLSVALCSDALPPELRWASLQMGLEYAKSIRYYGEANSEEREYGATTGLALYMPSDDIADEGYLNLRIADTAWPDLCGLLRNDSVTYDNGPGPELVTLDSINDADDLPDSCFLTWETDEVWNYSSFEVSTYSVRPAGLAFCHHESSTVPEISASGTAGTLMISASAFVGDEVHSHHILETTLHMLVTIDIIVIDEGEAYEGEIDVTLAAQSGERESVDCQNGACSVNITLPEWGYVGDLVTVQAVDAGDGSVLSERVVRLASENMSVELEVHRPAEESYPARAIVGLLVISALLIMSTVLYIYLERRR